MLKRRQGSHTSGRSHYSRCRDLYLMVLTHNAMLLILLRVFYRARMSPFCSRFFIRPTALRSEHLRYRQFISHRRR